MSQTLYAYMNKRNLKNKIMKKKGEVFGLKAVKGFE
jgi:hypothetical protein